MNEELSNIMEETLVHTSPLSVEESLVSMDLTFAENDLSVHHDFSIHHDLSHNCLGKLTEFGFSNTCSEESMWVTSSVTAEQTSSFNVADDTFRPNQIIFRIPDSALPSDSNDTQSIISNKQEYFKGVDLADDLISGDFVPILDHTETVSNDSSYAQAQQDCTSGVPSDMSNIAKTSLDFNDKLKRPVSVKSENDDTTKPKVKRRRRREKILRPPVDPILPPCSICEEKSSGYHYGANTCEACKGFFRRTLKKKEVDYKCRCAPEDKETWKRGPHKNGCPSCRYERCLSVGMSKNAIKIGRYTLNHRTKNITEVKTMEAVDTLITALTQVVSDDSPPSTSETSTSGSPASGTSTSGASTSGISASGTSFSCASLSSTSISGTDENSNTSTLDMTDLQTDIPTDDKPEVVIPKMPSTLEKSQMSLKEMDTIVKTLTEAHTSLQVDDRSHMHSDTIRQKLDEYLEKYKLKREIFGSLKQLNNDEFMEFYNATGIDIDDRLKRFDTAFKYFQEKITLIVAFAKSIPGFTSLGVDDQANLIKASRVETSFMCTYKNLLRILDMDKKVITAPWGMNFHLDEIEMFVPRDMMLGHLTLCKQLRGLNLSVQEESVLRAILVVFSDRCKLNEPGKVDAIQEKLICCLQYLLHLRHVGAGTSLYKIFNTLTDFRNLSETVLEFQKTLLLYLPLFSENNFNLLREFIA